MIAFLGLRLEHGVFRLRQNPQDLGKRWTELSTQTSARGGMWFELLGLGPPNSSNDSSTPHQLLVGCRTCEFGKKASWSCFDFPSNPFWGTPPKKNNAGLPFTFQTKQRDPGTNAQTGPDRPVPRRVLGRCLCRAPAAHWIDGKLGGFELEVKCTRSNYVQWRGCPFGCGSKNRNSKIQPCGNMDQNLRFAPPV